MALWITLDAARLEEALGRLDSVIHPHDVAAVAHEVLTLARETPLGLDELRGDLQARSPGLDHDYDGYPPGAGPGEEYEDG